MNKLYADYKGRVGFLVVYIQEAHPVDAWQDEDNVKANIALPSPKSFHERCVVAGTCLTKLSLQIPSVVDGIDNPTESTYTAWPDRLYVIDREGKVAYKSQPGPYGFKPAEVGETLRRILPAPPTQVTQAN